MSASAKRWAIALLASLAVNLFLGGMLVGRWIERPKAGASVQGERGGLSLPRLRRHLDPPAQATLDEVVAKHRPEIRDRRRKAGRARRRAMAALVAEPFDQAQARAALDEFGDKSLAMQQGAHEAMLELAASLTPAERQRLREAMASRRKGLEGKRRRRQGGPRERW